MRKWGETDTLSPVRPLQEMGLEIDRLWKRVRIDCGWGGAPPIRRLSGDERAVPAILELLKDTRVGKMPGRILLAGGPDLEEEELECFSLQVQGRGRG